MSLAHRRQRGADRKLNPGRDGGGMKHVWRRSWLPHVRSCDITFVLARLPSNGAWARMSSDP